MPVPPLPRILTMLPIKTEHIGHGKFLMLTQDQLDAACEYVGDLTTTDSQQRAVFLAQYLTLAKGDTKEYAGVVARAESLTKPGSESHEPPAPGVKNEVEALSPEMAAIVANAERGVQRVMDAADKPLAEGCDAGLAITTESLAAVDGKAPDGARPESAEGDGAVQAAPCAAGVL